MAVPAPRCPSRGERSVRRGPWRSERRRSELGDETGLGDESGGLGDENEARANLKPVLAKATRNKCIATSNKCPTSSNKKLLETSATLVVTGALLVVTRTLRTGLLALLGARTLLVGKVFQELFTSETFIST